MALTMANHLTVIEKALHRALRLAFRKRLEATPANLTVLASTSYPVYDGVLIFVTSENQIFEWSAASTATPDGVNVVAMPVSAQRPDNTNGRWLRVVSPLTYGPDANALLQNRAAGYCNAVELYEGNATAEDQIERVFAKTPAMLLKWERDAPKRADQRPGRVYWNYLTFTLFIGASNYRNAPAAQVGDAFGKIGIMEMIGDARYFLAGMDNLAEGVDYVEIGPAEVEAEDLKERVFIATLEVTVKVSFNILDRDLVAFAAQVQPKLTNQGQDEQSFDRLNFVGKGYRLAVGPGFTRSYVLGLATVGGRALSSQPPDVTLGASKDTYRDLGQDGTVTYVAVDNGADAPPVTEGCLRIARTVTDSAGIVSDDILCSSSFSFGSPFNVP